MPGDDSVCGSGDDPVHTGIKRGGPVESGADYPADGGGDAEISSFGSQNHSDGRGFRAFTWIKRNSSRRPEQLR